MEFFFSSRNFFFFRVKKLAHPWKDKERSFSRSHTCICDGKMFLKNESYVYNNLLYSNSMPEIVPICKSKVKNYWCWINLERCIKVTYLLLLRIHTSSSSISKQLQKIQLTWERVGYLIQKNLQWIRVWARNWKVGWHVIDLRRRNDGKDNIVFVY